MFLTKEILEKHNACAVGQKWFSRYFPEGAEMLDVIKSPKTNVAFLHWGFENLTTTKEELEAYWDRLNITNCNRETIIRSHNVDNSNVVIRSQDIENSDYIFSSKKIKSGNIIVNSATVENSHHIFESNFVYDSFNIYNGKNITESNNVVGSSFVVGSHSIYNASNVTNSFIVFDLKMEETSDIEECGFIANSKMLTNCLFCAGIAEKEYHIFNHPVSEKQFALIKKQLESIIGDYHPTYVENWGEKTVPVEMPNFQSPVLYHADLPEDFWEWVKTLPGYDPKILYQITFNPNLIDEF